MPVKIDDGAFLQGITLANPYYFLQQLRDAGDVQTESGVWIFATFEDVRNGLDDPGLASGPSEHSNDSSTLRTANNGVLLFADGRNHAELRQRIASSMDFEVRTFAKAFTLGCDLLGKRPGDAVTDLVQPAVAHSVCSMVGLPIDQAANILRWSIEASDLLDPRVTDRQIAAGRLASVRMMRLVASQVRDDSNAGAIGRLRAGSAGGGLGEIDLLRNVVSLVSAAIDTSTGLLTAILALLDGDPDLRRSLFADRLSVRRFVDEASRLESPVQLVYRTATHRAGSISRRVGLGDDVVLLLGSANRDSRKYDQADMVRLGREQSSHLGFGAGPHRCLGAGMARALGAVAVDLLLERWDSFSLVPGQATFRRHAVFRSRDRMPTLPRI